jgi:thymidylate synthase (FAD)
MKFILEPKVYLVGCQMIDYDGLNRFLEDEQVDWTTDTMSDPQKLCEVAGRLCYMSFSKPRPGGNAAYLDNILKSSHGSVLEHAVWNFIITGVSRSFSHELVRHRAGVGFSQLSQRYVDSSDCNFVVPWELQVEFRKGMEYLTENHSDWQIDGCPSDNVNHALEIASDAGIDDIVLVGLDFIHSMLKAQYLYKRHTDYLMNKFANPQGDRTEIRKRARQTARSVLPNATETKIFLTANARALRHMIEMRAAGPAEAEIRRVFVDIQKIMKDEAPNIFGDYTIEKLADGTFACSTVNRKV